MPSPSDTNGQDRSHDLARILLQGLFQEDVHAPAIYAWALQTNASGPTPRFWHPAARRTNLGRVAGFVEHQLEAGCIELEPEQTTPEQNVYRHKSGELLKVRGGAEMQIELGDFLVVVPHLNFQNIAAATGATPRRFNPLVVIPALKGYWQNVQFIVVGEAAGYFESPTPQGPEVISIVPNPFHLKLLHQALQTMKVVPVEDPRYEPFVPSGKPGDLLSSLEAGTARAFYFSDRTIVVESCTLYADLLLKPSIHSSLTGFGVPYCTDELQRSSDTAADARSRMEVFAAPKAELPVVGFDGRTGAGLF